MQTCDQPPDASSPGSVSGTPRVTLASPASHHPHILPCSPPADPRLSQQAPRGTPLACPHNSAILSSNPPWSSQDWPDSVKHRSDGAAPPPETSSGFLLLSGQSLRIPKTASKTTLCRANPRPALCFPCGPWASPAGPASWEEAFKCCCLFHQLLCPLLQLPSHRSRPGAQTPILKSVCSSHCIN